MASEADAAQDRVVLASFENRRAAEHMLASLRRGFRKKARKGHATALVISGNEDGSLKLTQSRVLSASGFVYTVPHAALALVSCDDRELRLAIVASASDRACQRWDGSRLQFLAGLDPGTQHDWIRAVVGAPSSADR